MLVSLPWILYQAWAFVAPGLYDHEKKFALPLIGFVATTIYGLVYPRLLEKSRGECLIQP